jgi:hypothetical protein
VKANAPLTLALLKVPVSVDDGQDAVLPPELDEEPPEPELPPPPELPPEPDEEDEDEEPLLPEEDCPPELPEEELLLEELLLDEEPLLEEELDEEALLEDCPPELEEELPLLLEPCVHAARNNKQQLSPAVNRCRLPLFGTELSRATGVPSCEWFLCMTGTP